jgi:hypothetical protein
MVCVISSTQKSTSACQRRQIIAFLAKCHFDLDQMRMIASQGACVFAHSMDDLITKMACVSRSPEQGWICAKTIRAHQFHNSGGLDS